TPAMSLGDDVDPPVLRSTRGRRIARHRPGLAVPGGPDPARADALVHQVVTDRGRATLGELHVVLVGPYRVRVTLDQDAHVRIRAHGRHPVIHVRAPLRREHELVELEARPGEALDLPRCRRGRWRGRRGRRRGRRLRLLAEVVGRRPAEQTAYHDTA